MSDFVSNNIVTLHLWVVNIGVDVVYMCNRDTTDFMEYIFWCGIAYWILHICYFRWEKGHRIFWCLFHGCGACSKIKFVVQNQEVMAVGYTIYRTVMALGFHSAFGLGFMLLNTTTIRHFHWNKNRWILLRLFNPRYFAPENDIGGIWKLETRIVAFK